MKDILSRAGRAALEEAAAGTLLLGFDYDGTLAPIAPRPQDARMRRSTARLLAELSRRYPCAIISGRARSDLVSRVGKLPLLVGNHGAEFHGRAPPVPRREILRWAQTMERAASGVRGVLVEDKTWSVSVHWRAARPKPAARDRVLAAARAIEGVRVVHGKDVVNLVHPDASDKGEALLRLRRQFACEKVIYAGDDVTDEDVFRLRDGVVSVRVGRSARSTAPWYVKSQAQIDDLLELLLNLRPAPVSRSEA